MEQNTIMYTMLAVCISMILLVAFSKPLGYVFRFFKNMLFGGALLLLAQPVFHSIGLQIGFNPLTVAFLGFLGLPGFGTLLLISTIL